MEEPQAKWSGNFKNKFTRAVPHPHPSNWVLQSGTHVDRGTHVSSRQTQACKGNGLFLTGQKPSLKRICKKSYEAKVHRTYVKVNHCTIMRFYSTLLKITFNTRRNLLGHLEQNLWWPLWDVIIQLPTLPPLTFQINKPGRMLSSVHHRLLWHSFFFS